MYATPQLPQTPMQTNQPKWQAILNMSFILCSISKPELCVRAVRPADEWPPLPWGDFPALACPDRTCCLINTQDVAFPLAQQPQLLFSCSQDGTLRGWDCRAGQQCEQCAAGLLSCLMRISSVFTQVNRCT